MRRRELLPRRHRRCEELRRVLSRRRRLRVAEARDGDRGQDPVRIADGHRAQAGAQARQLPPHQTRRRPRGGGHGGLRPGGPGQGERRARGSLHVRVRRRRRPARRRPVVLQVGVRELEGRAVRDAVPRQGQVRGVRVRQQGVRSRTIQRGGQDPRRRSRQARRRTRSSPVRRRRELGEDGGTVPRLGGQARGPSQPERREQGNTRWTEWQRCEEG